MTIRCLGLLACTSRNKQCADLCPSVFCWSSTLQHSALCPIGLTEFPLHSIGRIDNLILVTSASPSFIRTAFHASSFLHKILALQMHSTVISVFFFCHEDFSISQYVFFDFWNKKKSTCTNMYLLYM